MDELRMFRPSTHAHVIQFDGTLRVLKFPHPQQPKWPDIRAFVIKGVRSTLELSSLHDILRLPSDAISTSMVFGRLAWHRKRPAIPKKNHLYTSSHNLEYSF